jgi:hypothetical protein
LEAVQLAERSTGRRFVVQHIPEAALQAQLATATDPLQQSFAGLMLYCAGGEVIDMTCTLRDFPGQRLTSVREYLEAGPNWRPSKPLGFTPLAIHRSRRGDCHAALLLQDRHIPWHHAVSRCVTLVAGVARRAALLDHQFEEYSLPVLASTTQSRK